MSYCTPPHTPSHRSTQSQSTISSPSKTRTPLASSRTVLKHSRSNGALARQFVDRHSTTYAHLYEHPDEAVRREKLEAEESRLEEERRAGREMRERMMRIKLGSGDQENQPFGEISSQRRGASWRPLSLVAKRQNIGGGHSRSVSHQIPSTLLPISSNRSVSDTPKPSRISPLKPATTNLDRQLEVVVERERPDSSSPSSESHEGDTTLSSEPKSTYSWATSFSGETSELRATATYLRHSLERQSSVPIPEAETEETLDTPEKVKRRRKRIVAIAHTVRQLEGVGSREAEDPEFYGELVKAWNDRPFGRPAAVPKPDIGSNTWMEGPPALLPPPNLAGPSTRYADVGPPPFDRHLGSPPTPHLFTPALGFSSHSDSPYSQLDEVYEYDEDLDSDTSSAIRGRSFRNSYASNLHDLAFEDATMQPIQPKARWSKAWEGWGERPPPVDPRSRASFQPNHIPRSAPGIDFSSNPYPPPQCPLPATPSSHQKVKDQSAETPTKDAGWGLGFMSAWWADRPSPPVTEGEGADFQMGECRPLQNPTPTRPSRQVESDEGVEELEKEVGDNSSSTPGHHTTSTSGDQSMSMSETVSGVSTPSFGMRINSEAEWRWARPEIIRRSDQSPSKYISHSPPPPLPLPLPHTEVQHQPPSWSAPAMPTLDSATSTILNQSGIDTEFPFSNHCRPPSCSIPSTSSSLVSVPSEIQHLRQDREEGSQYLGGLASGSFPSDRTLRPRMLRQSSQLDEGRIEVLRSEKKEGLLARRQVRPLKLGELLNPFPLPPSIDLPEPTPVAESIHPHPLPHLHSEELLIERQSSTSLLDMTIPKPQLSPATSLSPTPTSIQTLFLPPHPSPIGNLNPSPTSPSREVFYRTEAGPRLVPRKSSLPILHQSSDPSSFLCDLNGPNGGIQPVQPTQDIVDMRGQPGRLSQSIGRKSDRRQYRDNTPSIITVVMAPKRRTIPSMALFWLGFIMPWCWIFGGWPAASEVVIEKDVEKGEEVKEQNWVSRWMYHPDPWARRCRFAAGVVLPLVAVGGVAGVIVLAVMRGG